MVRLPVYCADVLTATLLILFSAATGTWFITARFVLALDGPVKVEPFPRFL